jgi:L-asparaginase
MKFRSGLSLVFLILTISTLLSANTIAELNKPLPNIHILATGGTIAGTAPNETELGHYTPGQLGIDTLIQSVPELSTYAGITGEQVYNLNSDEITPAIWLNLSRRANDLLSSPDVDGIVITHGTDTLEDTAYFLNLVVKSEKPIVITGAMRPATAISADGPLNLLNAVILAGSSDAKGKGVLIALNGEINGARDTTKTNTETVETFRSPDFGQLGYMDNKIPKFFRESTKKHTYSTEFDLTSITSLPKVDIVELYPGVDRTAIDAFTANGSQGLVIAGMGNGGYPGSIRTALQDVVHTGIPVVVSSRTGTGISTPEDQEFISSDTLTPQKARVLLMLALTKTQDPERIAEIFRVY